jgi:hypothetical protein
MLLFLSVPATALAQAALGKLQGRVSDVVGVALADAQISVTGTAFTAVTDRRGNYFINNVPAGKVDVRAVLIGYQPLEVRGLVILAGQSITQDFSLVQHIIELQEIVVVSAANLLVPRDEVTTRQRLNGAYTDKLPVDRLTDALVLQPGVVASSQRSTLTLSIRGGRPDEAAYYVDGVPVSTGFRGTGQNFMSVLNSNSVQGSDLFEFHAHGLDVGVNAVEEASVVSGAPSAEFGNAQSGIISIQTRSGGARYSGSLGYETDEPFGVSHSIGLNRISAGLGGPISHGLTWFASGVLEGRKSAEDGAGAEKYPLFVAAGIDTTVRVDQVIGLGQTAPTDVPILRFAVYRGRCEDFQNSSNREIAQNYGLACQGIRIPSSASSSYQVSGKLSYSYGNGSRLAFSLLGNQEQARNFLLTNVFGNQYTDLYNPAQLQGTRDASRAFTLTLTQNLARSSERALAVDLALSYQQDQTISGPLAPGSELATRDPFGGFMVKPLGLRFDFDNFPINDQLIGNVRRDDQTTRLTPYDIQNPEQYRLIDQWRNNAYGLTGFSEDGGPVGNIHLFRENRVVSRGALDWQVDRFNRLRTGAEATWYSITNYSSSLETFDGDAYIEHPVRWDLYGEDRLDLGDLVLAAGLRLDYYDSRASRPRRFPEDSAVPIDEFNNRTTQRVRDRSHHYLSPHIQVAFPVTTRTAFRLSYAHQVQAPDFGLVLAGINGHPAIPSLGSDLDFGRTISFEFGIRHSFSDDMVLDISAYNKDKVADAAVRNQTFYDGRHQSPHKFLVMTNADYGNVRGVDVRLDRRIGQLFNGTLGYTYQRAQNTGSDPFSVFQFSSLLLTQLEGGEFLPPQGTFLTNDDRTHNLTGSMALEFPSGWHRESALGLLRGVGMFATFRFASGTPYTKCPAVPENQDVLSFDRGCSQVSDAVENNGARLPAQKQFDLRLTKGFALGRSNLTAYMDVRNLFNFQNVVRVFSVNGNTRNDFTRHGQWAHDSTSFAQEADQSGARLPDGAIDLRLTGSSDPRQGCATWVTASGAPAAPNCVYLIGAEERFGNGDHIFSVAEQQRASYAFYAVGPRGGLGPQRFVEPGRWVRVGLELSF